MRRSVFKVGDDYYLSGTDETMRDMWRSFFMAQLPHAVKTVDEAIEALKPDEIKRVGDGFVRQGEWYFVPDPEKVTRYLTPCTTTYTPEGLDPWTWKDKMLHCDLSRQRRHEVTELRMDAYGQRWVRGWIPCKPRWVSPAHTFR